LRKLLTVLLLASGITAPAVAANWNDDLARVMRHWTPPAPQSAWRPDGIPDQTEAGYDPALIDPFVSHERRGAGWALLDGWMRGDPVLRQWVLSRFDANGDTWLSEDEAEVARRTFYSMADTNGSGRITSEEFVLGWAQARDELRRTYAVAG